MTNKGKKGRIRKTYYGVGLVKDEHPVSVAGHGVYNLKLQWADGMVGVIPVFETKKEAEKYSKGKLSIFTFTAEGVFLNEDL